MFSFSSFNTWDVGLFEYSAVQLPFDVRRKRLKKKKKKKKKTGKDQIDTSKSLRIKLKYSIKDMDQIRSLFKKFRFNSQF